MQLAPWRERSLSRFDDPNFKYVTKREIIFVPFRRRAGGQRIARQSCRLINYSEGMEQIKAGKLRALATTSAQRIKPAPDLPTIGKRRPLLDADLRRGVRALHRRQKAEYGRTIDEVKIAVDK
jgi:hypothetical protein